MNASHLQHGGIQTQTLPCSPEFLLIPRAPSFTFCIQRPQSILQLFTNYLLHGPTAVSTRHFTGAKKHCNSTPWPTIFISKAEFSPPLDTSLIAAIVADYVTESSFETSSDEQLQTLRATLQMLAAQAEQDEEYALSDKFSNLHISPQSTADDCSTDYMFTESTTSTSDTSEASSFISALAFLQAIFPQLSADKLLKTLNKVGDIEDVDMENVVEELLTGEYVRELEELGVDGVDAEVQDDDEPWKTAEGKPRVKSKQGKKANKRGITIPIVDIRQRNHAHAQPGPSRLPPPDPWAQLSSVASYLQTLIPSHQSTFFLSHFHSPDYANPGDALRAALFSISRASTSTEESEYALLSSVLDLLQEDEMYKTRNAEQRDRLERDAILALRATQAQPDLASDILRLLLELDTDNLAWGVYHAPVPVQTKNNYSPRPVKLPKGPPSIPQPPLRWKSTIPSNDMNSWMTVPISRRTNVPDTLANSIPAYNASNTIRRARANGKMGELLASKKMEQLGDRSEGHRRRMVELMAQQRDAMREASRAWQKGNSKSRGGEVALFYADRVSWAKQYLCSADIYLC